ARLRLFLKLAAEVDPSRRKKNFGLEPLPDIDFNIRSGNTLAGFATEQQLEEVVKNSEGDLMYEEKLAKLKSDCDMAAASFAHFKTRQLIASSDSFAIREAKQDYANAIAALNEKLNHYLADTYGLGAKTQWKSETEKDQVYRDWITSHQPFHWFAEFYEIISRGGFDVVIGNPPYVETRKVEYKIKNYETEPCGNLYVFAIERSLSILKMNSNIGMIIPISSVANSKFYILQNIFSAKTLSWFSNYSNRPAKLFENVEQRLTIFVGKKCENIHSEYYTCSYKHWYAKAREYLFPTISYCINRYAENNLCFSKIGNAIEQNINTKLGNNSKIKIIDFLGNDSRSSIYYHNAPTYFIRAMSFMPNSGKNMEPSSHYKCVNISKNVQSVISCILNSSLFYFFYKNFSNCRDFSEREIYNFPLGQISEENINNLNKIEARLMKNYMENKKIKNRTYESGLVYYDEYYPKLSKPIIDEIDKVLAKHYGFTDEELDFIINYDIKYRMGGELEGE
ncbi:MAG: Eco57I restriction-modification methylase domain-containing protein, partial [Treponema sp.]|nr:Eco57I restriction-modification methylase domain-containing protein [Treponema sp.]